MITNPLISVLMPAYNTENYIGAAIESILNQSFANFELLICDDGSTDSTFDICQTFKNRDSRIRLFRNKKNIGNLKTTNFLFTKLEGEFITFQDSDDVSMDNRLELCLKKMKKNPDLGLLGANFYVTDKFLNPKCCGNLPNDDQSIKELSVNELPPFLFATTFVRKEMLNKIGGFRTIFNRKGFADLDWLSRILEITSVENLKEIVYYYRKHEQHFNKPNSLIGKHGEILIKEAIRQRSIGQIDFLENQNFFKIRKYLSLHYSKLADNYIWNSNFKLAQINYFKSILVFPLNFYSFKSFFKTLYKY